MGIGGPSAEKMSVLVENKYPRNNELRRNTSNRWDVTHSYQRKILSSVLRKLLEESGCTSWNLNLQISGGDRDTYYKASAKSINEI